MALAGALALLVVFVVVIGLRDPAAPAGVLGSPASAATPGSESIGRKGARDVRAGLDRTPASLPIVHHDDVGTLAGIVLDDAGVPVPGVTLRLAGQASGRSTALVASSGSDGRFRWDEIPTGLYRLRADNGEREAELTVAVPDDDVVLRFAAGVVQPGVALRVRVLDDQARPVASAAVAVTGDIGRLRGQAGADGICVFEGERSRNAMVVAATDDGRSGSARHYANNERGDPPQVDVVVSANGQLLGTLRSGSGGAVPESVTIVAHLGASGTPFGRSHAVEFSAPLVNGSYRFDDIPSGMYAMSARGLQAGGLCLASGGSQAGASLRSDEGWILPIMVHVQSGATVRCDLFADSAAAVLGQVKSATGQPIADAVVRCSRLLRPGRGVSEGMVAGAPVEVTSASDAMMLPRYETWVRSAEDGSFSFGALVPGPYRITVEAVGRARVVDQDLTLTSGHQVRRDYVLAAAGRLEVAVGHEAIVAAYDSSPDSSWCRAASTDSAGLVVFSGVPEGRLLVGVLEREQFAQLQLTMSHPPKALREVEIRAGETSFVDLRNALPVRFEGTVLESGTPVVGADVELLGRRTRTNEQGRFVLRYASPIRGEEYLRLKRDGLLMAFAMPAESRDVEVWQGQFEFASSVTTISTRAADGSPAAAELVMSGGVRGVFRTRADVGDLELALPRRGIEVEATFANGAVVAATVELGGRTELVAPVATSLQVSVVDRMGRPMRRVRVAVTVWGESSPPPIDWWPATTRSPASRGANGVTNAEGRVELRGVPAGEAIVYLAPRLGGGTAEPVRLRLEANQPARAVLRLEP